MQNFPHCSPPHLWISLPNQPGDRSELQSNEEHKSTELKSKTFLQNNVYPPLFGIVIKNKTGIFSKDSTPQNYLVLFAKIPKSEQEDNYCVDKDSM